MTIVDLYLIRQFCKIFLVSFFSIAGLYVVIHVFTNLDEVVTISGSTLGFSRLLFEFYLPRLLDLFARSSGMLILIAAVFSIGLMQRRRETTATEAAGIPKARLVRPIVFISLLVIAMSAISRETYIPQYKAMLVRNLNNWTNKGAVPMHLYKDWETGILVKGAELVIEEGKITQVSLTLPRQISPSYVEIRSDSGWIKHNDPQYPVGILCQDIHHPKNLLESDNVDWNETTVIHTPRNSPWLTANQVFVECQIDVQDLAYGENLFRYSSVSEMITSLGKPNRRLRLGDRVALHQRIVKPILELSLLLIGLPLVISDPHRSIFLGAASCMGLIVVIEVTVAGCHALGSFGMIRSAELAAWLPVILITPLSAFSMRKLFD